jgi:hypothetical protein
MSSHVSACEDVFSEADLKRWDFQPAFVFQNLRDKMIRVLLPIRAYNLSD